MSYGSKAAVRVGDNYFCSAPDSRPADAVRQTTRWAQKATFKSEAVDPQRVRVSPSMVFHSSVIVTRSTPGGATPTFAESRSARGGLHTLMK